MSQTLARRNRRVSATSEFISFDANGDTTQELDTMSVTITRQLGGSNSALRSLGLAFILVARSAIAQPPDADRPIGEIVRPALIEAARRGDLAGVKARLARRDAVDLRDPFQSTALIEAAWGGHLPIVELLLQRGADVNAANQARATALMGAAVHDAPEIAALLLRSDAKIDAIDASGKTPLVLAAESNSTRVIPLLVKHAADVNARAADGSTPLVEAAARGQMDAVKTLLDLGANVDAAARDGRTPLIAAVESRRAEVVAELLLRGADVNRTGPSGETARELARKRGDTEISALFRPSSGKNAVRQETEKASKDGKPRKSTAPELVSSNVDGDDLEVDPQLTELVLTFDRPMHTRRYHLTTVNAKKYGIFPELVGEDPIEFRDARTMVLHVKLEPRTKYGFGMNDDGRLEFRSADGVPLEPLIFYFRTGGAQEEASRRAPRQTEATGDSGQGNAGPDPQTLLRRVIEQPTKENYLAARSFAVGHASYKPYSSDLEELADTEDEAACKIVLRTLEQASPNLLFSPRAHLWAAIAAEKLGDEKRQQRELRIAKGLIQGILATGDGTRQKPYAIVRPTDENDLLMHLDKRQDSQSLVQEGGTFDVILCTDGTEIWFEISNIFGRF